MASQFAVTTLEFHRDLWHQKLLESLAYRAASFAWSYD